MSRIQVCLAGAALSLSIASLQAQTPREWPTYPIKEAPAELRPAIQRGDLVIVSIQNAVLSELTRELTERGAGGAILVCHMSSTVMTNRLAREEGLSAGRRPRICARLRMRQDRGPRPLSRAMRTVLRLVLTGSWSISARGSASCGRSRTAPPVPPVTASTHSSHPKCAPS